MCLHCIFLVLLGFVAMIPFIGPFFAAQKAAMEKRLNKSCDDESCLHSEGNDDVSDNSGD